MIKHILSGRGIVGLGLLALMAVFFVKHYIDRAMNYQQVQGKVSSTLVDCYVERGKEFLSDPKTHQMAYMPCDTAPQAAASAGFGSDDVKRHIQVLIDYVSPVDGKSHSAEYNQYNTNAVYNVGDAFVVYASLKDPHKYSTW
jgi:hypothetical protein